MPNADKCQQMVIRALIQAGWHIVLPAKRYLYKHRRIYLDLVAEKDGQIIYIEVKCFTDEDNSSTDHYQALGQYLFYRETLGKLQDNTQLYLAIPRRIYLSLDDVAEALYKTHSISVLVFDETETDGLQWIN